MNNFAPRRTLAALLSVLMPLATFAGAFAVSNAPVASAASSGIETREAFVVQLAQALNVQPATSTTQVFSDVPTSDPDFGYIMAASQAGWISGFPGGTFQPNGTLTREQMVKVEILALKLQSQAIALGSEKPNYSDADAIGRWAWGHVNEATAIGILQGFTNGTFGPENTFSTAQAADAVKQLQAYLAPHAAPAVSAVTPSSGSVAGGTVVTITGTGFTGATAVKFGTENATAFSLVSATSITATAPAGTGTVDVTVTTPNGTSVVSSSAEFSYASATGGGSAATVPTEIRATPTAPVAFSSGSQAVTFTVRNQYGSAMSGETVRFGVTGTLVSGDLGAVSGTTDSSGQVTVTYADSTVGHSGTVTGLVDGYPSVATATAILSVVNSGAQVSGYDTASTTTTGTAIVAGGSGTSTPDTTATASNGTGSVTVQTFNSNPGPVTGAFSSTGTYFDVSLSTSNSFPTVTIQQCGVTASSLLYWFDGTSWSAVSPAASYSSSSGCLSFTATDTSAPSVSALTGTQFAVTQAAPALTSGIRLSAGGTVGTTKIAATPNQAGDTFTVQVSSSSIPTPDLNGAAPTGAGYTAQYTAGSDIQAAVGDDIGVYEIRSGLVVAFSQVEVGSGDVAIAAAPTLQSAVTSIDGDAVTLTFDKAMNNPSGDASDFTVTVAGTVDQVTSASFDGANTSAVYLVVQNQVTNGQSVTVSYSGTDVTAQDGGVLAAFSGQAVTNDVPPPAPLVQSAVTSTDGSTIILTFDRAMNDPSAYASDFSVTVGTSVYQVTGAALDASNSDIIDLTLQTPVAYGQTPTVSYSGTGVTGTDYGVLASFSGRAVTNGIPAAAPTLQGAATSTDGGTVALTFDKAMNDPSAFASDFTVTIEGTSEQASAASLDGSNHDVIDLSLTSPAGGGQTVTVAFNGGPNVTSTDGGVLANFSGQSVTDDSTGPGLLSASTSTDGSTIILTFNKAMSDPSAYASDFTVTYDNGVYMDEVLTTTFDSSNPDAIDLNMDGSVGYGVTVTVSYSGTGVTATDATVLWTFTRAVTNTMVTPPTLQSAATSTDGTEIILTFDKAMSVPANEADQFSARLAGTQVFCSQAVVDDSNPDAIDLTLPTAATAGESVTLVYTGYGVTSTDGGILVDWYTPLPVTNNVQ